MSLEASYNAPGEVRPWYNNTGADIVAGDIVSAYGKYCVAAEDITSATDGNLIVFGDVRVRKSAVVMSQGTQVFWSTTVIAADGSTGAATVSQASGRYPLGEVALSAAAADTTVVVCLNNVRGRVDGNHLRKFDTTNVTNGIVPIVFKKTVTPTGLTGTYSCFTPAVRCKVMMVYVKRNNGNAGTLSVTNKAVAMSAVTAGTTDNAVVQGTVIEGVDTVSAGNAIAVAITAAAATCAFDLYVVALPI